MTVENKRKLTLEVETSFNNEFKGSRDEDVSKVARKSYSPIEQRAGRSGEEEDALLEKRERRISIEQWQNNVSQEQQEELNFEPENVSPIFFNLEGSDDFFKTDSSLRFSNGSTGTFEKSSNIRTRTQVKTADLAKEVLDGAEKSTSREVRKLLK